MSDNKRQPDPSDYDNAEETRTDLGVPQNSNTTYDLSDAAREAIRRFEEAETGEDVNKSGVFTDNMLLEAHVPGHGEPLVVFILNQATIGRRDPASDYVPEFDLTPLGAYRLGVSRRHAILRVTNKELHIEDKGSRNGSFLNGEKLLPGKPRKVRDGDYLQIGNIEMRLVFRKKK